MPSTSSYLAGKKLQQQCTQWEDNGKETGKRVSEPISKMGKMVKNLTIVYDQITDILEGLI